MNINNVAGVTHVFNKLLPLPFNMNTLVSHHAQFIPNRFYWKILIQA